MRNLSLTIISGSYSNFVGHRAGKIMQMKFSVNTFQNIFHTIILLPNKKPCYKGHSTPLIELNKSSDIIQIDH